jgi:hypothetical protein
MKFHELDCPTCSRCGEKNLNAYSADCDREGDVQSVYCIDCRDGLNIDEWSSDKRLKSSLTLTAALKATSRPVVVTMQHRGNPPHPWEPEVMFRDGTRSRVSATLYSPRDPDFRQPVKMSAYTEAMREFRSGREFDVIYRGVRVAQGYVPAWDMRWLDVHEASQRVHAAVKAPDGFERVVWFGGLQKAVRATNVSALKGTFVAETGETVEVTTFCSGGRCVIQIETSADRVTLITAEDESEPRMGVQGIDATEETALRLLAATTSAWAAGSLAMAETTNVGML